MKTNEKIKYLRKEILRLSQDNFARKINVTRGTVNNWETSVSKPTTSHIIMISLLCEVSTDYLIYDNHPLELLLNDLEKEDYKILRQLINYFEKKDL